MKENQYKLDIQNYLKSIYGEVEFKTVDFKNNCFDLIIHNKNINLNIEYKHRFFETNKNDKYLYYDDILIELFQSIFEISNLKELKNNNINNKTTAHRINIAIGWFYKCTADRLLYLRYLDNELYDIIDLDYKPFKNWFMNSLDKFPLQFSDKTTGTINAQVKLNQIPKNMVLVTKYLTTKEHHEPNIPF